MAKMRDYVYGSPKFEREINKAVIPEGADVKSTGATSGKVLTANGSGGASWETASGGKVYQHNIDITAKDTNNVSHRAVYTIYNTTPNALITSESPLISDIRNLISSTCYNDSTPKWLTPLNFSYLYISGGTLKGSTYTFSTQQSASGTIGDITSASDTVREM